MEAETLTQFYEVSYSRAGREAELYGRWRALSAVGKADHVVSLCSRAGITPTSTLDVGCGDGALLSELAARGFGGRLAGVEITPAAAELASRREVGTISTYDGEHLPFGEHDYDLGILSHVLEHVPEPARLLAEVARVCRAVAVEVPLERNVSAARPGKRQHGDEIGHLHVLSREAMRSIVDRARLSVADEIEDPLPFAVHAFFASGRAARATAALKWATRTSLHRAAPPLARRLFTVHYACLCLPSLAGGRLPAGPGGGSARPRGSRGAGTA